MPFIVSSRVIPAPNFGLRLYKAIAVWNNQNHVCQDSCGMITRGKKWMAISVVPSLYWCKHCTLKWRLGNGIDKSVIREGGSRGVEKTCLAISSRMTSLPLITPQSARSIDGNYLTGPWINWSKRSGALDNASTWLPPVTQASADRKWIQCNIGMCERWSFMIALQRGPVAGQKPYLVHTRGKGPLTSMFAQLAGGDGKRRSWASCD